MFFKNEMPGEFEKHRGCVMIWPVRPGSWPNGGEEAQRTFSKVAFSIAESEHLWMLCKPGDEEKVYNKISEYFLEYKSENQNSKVNLEKDITVLSIETDDAWARDVGPTCVYRLESFDLDEGDINHFNAVSNDKVEMTINGIDWKFNAWGGDYDGLYASWDNDDAAASAICDKLGIEVRDAHPFVLEGGSIHSDGEGTVIVTESCLLSKGRNPQLTKSEIELRLLVYLGAKKVIWLPYGIYNDETNEHVDNVCAFARPGEVILAWTDDVNDPQYAMSKADLELLQNETDAKGRKFVIHKLPIPDVPVCVEEDELEGYEFEEGEDTREAGERLAASYVNFYISNDGIILPQFSDEKLENLHGHEHANIESDKRAVSILAEIFPERKIYPIYARPIIVGGGNIHCITQQII